MIASALASDRAMIQLSAAPGLLKGRLALALASLAVVASASRKLRTSEYARIPTSGVLLCPRPTEGLASTVMLIVIGSENLFWNCCAAYALAACTCAESPRLVTFAV